ncbi:MAG: hypothetical protein AAF530_16320 [Pseudomonadota bacterium]
MQSTIDRTLSPETLFNMARQHQSQGRLEEAQGFYEELLKQAPGHSQSFIMLGSISFQSGDDVQAAAYLDRAIEVLRNDLVNFPGHYGAQATLTNLLFARQQSAEAQELAAGLQFPINPIRASQEEFLARMTAGRDRGIPLLLINTVPKSASESIWNQLAEGLGIAQGHLSIAVYPDCCLIPDRLRSAQGGGLIAKEHIPATPFNLQVLRDHGVTRLIFHVRDPRQVALSWAHFVRDDVSMRMMGPIWRKIVPPADVLKAGDEGLIDWCIARFLPSLLDFIGGWWRVAQDPQSGLAVTFLSFEQFLDNPQGYMDQALAALGVDKSLYDASAQGETIHLRKGQTEEWREAFTKKQKAAAWEALPKELRNAFGWKK